MYMHNNITISLPTKGAKILPILENAEQDPIPAFLTTVGNISAAYW